MKTMELRSALLATGLTAAALFAGGCGNSSSVETAAQPQQPAPHRIGKIACHAIKLQKWQTIGSQLQTDRAAGALGVTGQQVADGKIGEARCNTPVPADPVGAGEAVVVMVRGVQDVENGRCLVIGLNSGDRPPEPNHAYRGIIAACAAPASFSNPA